MTLSNVGHQLRIREYYYMALRHKLAFFITTIIAVFISLIIAFSLPKIYRANMVLLVETEQILDPLISGLAITPSAYSKMRALRDQLLSWPRMTLLAEKLELDKEVESPLAYEKLINQLRQNISIRLRGRDLVSVGFEGEDPAKAQEIVQTLGDIIIDGAITSSNLEANSAIQFIEEQLESYRTKLEASEVKLREFRELYSSTLPVAVRMNEQLVQLKILLNNLLMENTEKHPRVIQTRQQIQQIEDQRDRQMEYARKAGFDVNPEEYARLVSSVPLQEQQLSKLRRDYDVNAGIYQRLLQRLETARISQTLEDSDKGMKFKVLEPARLPLEPVRPNKPLIAIAGMFIGMGLGVGLVILIEMGNTSIRNVEEARQLLELPIFGAIGTIKPEELLLAERMRAESRV